MGELVHQCWRCGRVFMRPHDLYRHYRKKNPCDLATVRIANVEMNWNNWMREQVLEPGTLDEMRDTASIELLMGRWFSTMGEWMKERWLRWEHELSAKMDVYLHRVDMHSQFMGLRRELPKDGWRNSFGEENVDFLNEEDKMLVLQSGSLLLTRCFQVMHLNPRCPANANVVCPNWRNKVLYVWEADNEWHRVTFEDWWSVWNEIAVTWIQTWLDELELSIDDKTRIENVLNDIEAVRDYAEGRIDKDEVSFVTRRRIQTMQRSLLYAMSEKKYTHLFPEIPPTNVQVD